MTELVRELGLLVVHLVEPGPRRRVCHQFPVALHGHLCCDAGRIFPSLERLHNDNGVEHVGEPDDAHGGDEEELVGEGLEHVVDVLITGGGLQQRVVMVPPSPALAPPFRSLRRPCHGTHRRPRRGRWRVRAP